ncbi:hypothetical protein DFH29DRAFT_882269 [Suillus ampliporus]|nr:hypothetical protein DFH29DRAFT_882269 [Suillus ampliporus]
MNKFSDADKVQELNDARRVTHVLTRLDDYKSLIIALSENDVPHMQYILAVVLKQGASIRQIINTLKDAIAGTCHPRGYTRDDLDIATLTYRLGGCQLLYALSHRLGLPSLRMLQTHRTFTSIALTIGPIAAEQFDANIKTLILAPLGSVVIPHRGHSLMMDKIALEEMASHHHPSNSVIGLCHSHSHMVDPTLHTYDSALRIAEKLAEGTVPLGKEMSVIAIGAFGDDEIFPILAAPTCKCEDADKMVSIVTLARDHWRETGAEEHLGPIFSVATDGDSMRRAAGHCMFLKHELSATSRLYRTLSDMPGLNLTTGDNETTLDFNYKHIIKLIGWCTLLRTHKGMKLNNGHSITSRVLVRYLAWLPDMDEHSVTKLLNPDDPQDVPRAVQLMQAIITLSKFPVDTLTGEIGTCTDMAAIKSLSTILESFLLLFVDITLSLQQQVAHLSHYAHLTFTFFRLYHSAFMPYVLFYDSQTMVKNACFCITKQQKLDGTQQFWLIQTGDGCLEKLFGITQMRSQHNSAMNYSQALDRISAAKDIDTILNLAHDDSKSFVSKDLTTFAVILWKDGRKNALTMLADAHMPVDGCDLMRPWGANKYLGVTTDIEVVDLSVVHAPMAPNTAFAAPTPTTDEEPPLEDDVLTLKEALTHNLPSGNPSIDVSPSDASNAPSLTSGPGINPDDFLLVRGKYIHKETICCCVLNKDFVAKSLNRQERVYSTSFTKVNRRHELPGRSITGGNSFIIGDVFLTIIRSNATLTLTLVRSTLIEHNGITRHDILIPNVCTPNVKLTGQILALVPTRKPAVEHSWLWTGDYVKTNSEIQGINQMMEKIIEITVPGVLVELVNPDTTCVRLHDDINSDDFIALNNIGNTWVVEESALTLACDVLWTKACEHSISVKSILHVPTLSNPSVFPYALPDGSAGIVCMEASEQLAAAESGPLVDSSRGTVEENLKEQLCAKSFSASKTYQFSGRNMCIVHRIAILWLDADNVLHKYVNSSVCEEEGFAVRHVWVAFGDWQVTVWLPVPMSTSFLVVNACHDLESDSKQDHKEDLRHEGRWY